MIDPLELHAYADGQLSKADRDRISLQLETDAASKAELDSIAALKGFVSEKCEPVACKAEWQKCVGRLNELDKSKRTESLIGRYAWALCGIFFLTILGGGILNRVRGTTGGDSADLARVVASLTPTGTSSSNEPKAVKKWLDEMVGQAAASIDPDRLHVRSRAIGNLDGMRAVRLGLSDGTGDMSLVVIDGDVFLDELPKSNTEPFRTGQLQGTNFIAWHEHGDTLVLLGDRRYDALIDTVQSTITR